MALVGSAENCATTCGGGGGVKTASEVATTEGVTGVDADDVSLG